ncbi:MAG: hypothetical protein LBI17_01085 [Rickettsiales bacterium]|jgi:hypothetical protein|nr:hypothetical protein [Rickettsiales bacterium]
MVKRIEKSAKLGRITSKNISKPENRARVCELIASDAREAKEPVNLVKLMPPEYLVDIKSVRRHQMTIEDFVVKWLDSGRIKLFTGSTPPKYPTEIVGGIILEPEFVEIPRGIDTDNNGNHHIGMDRMPYDEWNRLFR